MIISKLFCVIRNVSDKSCTENRNSYFYSVSFFFSENRTGYKIMWKNIVQPDSPQMTIWRMRVSRWVSKATNTYSQYVILTVFALQYWLKERASKLRYTYIACTYLNINQLDALNIIMSLFHASTCFEHHVLILRRSKLYYTTSGIITLKQVIGLKLLKKLKLLK